MTTSQKTLWLVIGIIATYGAIYFGSAAWRDAFFRTFRFPIDRTYQAPQDGGVDQKEFAYLAENLLAKKVFSLSDEAPHIPETWRTPGYPAFVAIWLGALKSYVPVILSQILIVAATAALIMRIGRILGSENAGLAAGLLYAANPTVVMNAFDLFSDTLFLGLFTAAMYLLLTASHRRYMNWLWLSAGILLGMATLVRTTGAYLPFILVPGVIVMAPKGHIKKHVIGAVLILAGFAAATVPWMMRNKHVSGNFSLSSLGAYHLYFYGIGSFLTDQTGIHDATIRQRLRDEINIQDEQRLRSFAASSALMEGVKRHVAKDPVGYTWHYAVGAVKFFLGTSLKGFISFLALPQTFLPPMVVSGIIIIERIFWLAILALSAIPLLKKNSLRLKMLLLAGFVGYFAALGAFFPSPRYRLQALPCLFLLATLGIQMSWHTNQAGRKMPIIPSTPNT